MSFEKRRAAGSHINGNGCSITAGLGRSPYVFYRIIIYYYIIILLGVRNPSTPIGSKGGGVGERFIVIVIIAIHCPEKSKEPLHLHLQ
jgi:hypothetical protein